MRRSWTSVGLALLAIGVVLPAHSTQDQSYRGVSTHEEPNLDKVAKSLSQQIDKAKIKSVLVADFLSPEGNTVPQGEFLAIDFSERLENYKKKFLVVGTRYVDSEAALQQLTKSSEADAIVTGTIETNPDNYRIIVTVKSTRNDALSISEEHRIKRPSYLDRFAPYLGPIKRSGEDSIGAPECLYCPSPGYPEDAKKNRIQSAKVVLQLVITPEGEGAGFKILKNPGHGFAEKSVQAVSKWKFKPAVDKDGTPVAITVPVEVTFHSGATFSPDFGSSAIDQINLDKIAQDLALQMKKAGIKLAIVEDFHVPEANSVALGKFLAESFSASLSLSQNDVKVLARRKLSDAADKLQLSPEKLMSVENIQNVGRSLNVDGVLAGTLVASQDQYVLTVTPYLIKGDAVLDSSVQSFRLSLLDKIEAQYKLILQYPPAAQNGITSPTCIDCPSPAYSDRARGAGSQGTVLLHVVVNEKGKPTYVSVIRDPGEDLADVAVETVKTWKLKPATDKIGSPVAVMVPIEVTFRLSKK